MQPDLFSGPVQRNDSYRLLARLAHGGRVPAPARRWSLDPSQRRRLAAVTGLLALGIVAWAWLQAGHAPVSAAPPATAQDAAPAPWQQPAETEPTQAALIVSQPEAPATPTAPKEDAIPPAARLPPGPPGARIRPPKPGTAQASAPSEAARSRRSAAPMESDEDVTLLAAMLKHAKPPKPPAMPPPKEQ